MKKQHKNLSIDNLTKTEWFNQFNEEQKNEILNGLEDNLDVSIYAKPEFDCLEMEEIRLGLEDDLDVSIYAKSEFDWEEMRSIRLDLYY